MNLKYLFTAAFLATSATLLTPAKAQMVPSNDRVRVVVTVETKSDKKDIPNSTASTTTQHKTMTVTLSGKAKSGDSRTVEWKAWGREVQGNALKVLDSGNVALALDDRGTQTFKTTEVTTTYTPDHTVTNRNNNNNNNGNRRTNRVEGSGTKFAGYSIKVMAGTTVVGEASDPVGIDRSK